MKCKTDHSPKKSIESVIKILNDDLTVVSLLLLQPGVLHSSQS